MALQPKELHSERLWKSIIPAALHISRSRELYRLGRDDPPAGTRARATSTHYTRYTQNDVSPTSLTCLSNA